MTIFGRQPAFWIGLIVSLVVAVLQVLTGQGVVSDALAGRITEGVNALAGLATVFAPLIAGLLIKQGVTPVSAPSLPVGTAVNAGTASVVASPPPAVPVP